MDLSPSGSTRVLHLWLCADKLNGDPNPDPDCGANPDPNPDPNPVASPVGFDWCAKVGAVACDPGCGLGVVVGVNPREKPPNAVLLLLLLLLAPTMPIL
jgi:hypothetical protein